MKSGLKKRNSGSRSGRAHTKAHIVRESSDKGNGLRKSVYVCKTTGEIKVSTHVTIRKEIFDRVIAVAPLVYGIQRGALERAIEDALELWLQLRVNKTGIVTNPRSPLRERYNAVIECIEEEVGMVPITIHQLFFERCISNTFNIKDPRSIYGWLHRFYQAGLIKPLTVKVSDPKDWKRNKSIEIVAKRV